MSEFLEKYLDAGYSGIVRIAYDHKESGSGHIEKTTETVVARKGKNYFQVEAYQRLAFLGNSSGYFEQRPSPIDEAQYAALAADNPIMDTPEERNNIAAAKKRSEFIDALGKELEALAPKCPKCSGDTTRRTGPRGPFWGCQNFPNCKGSASFSAKAKALNEHIRNA
jgi:hypothetical protein